MAGCKRSSIGITCVLVLLFLYTRPQQQHQQMPYVLLLLTLLITLTLISLAPLTCARKFSSLLRLDICSQSAMEKSHSVLFQIYI